MGKLSSSSTTTSNLEVDCRTLTISGDCEFGSSSSDENLTTINGRAYINEQVNLYDMIINNVPYVSLQSRILAANMPTLTSTKTYNIVNISESNANATGIVLPSIGSCFYGTIIKVQCRILAFGSTTNYISVFANGWQDGSGLNSQRIYFKQGHRTSLRLQNGQFVELIQDSTVGGTNWGWKVLRHNGISYV